MKKSILPALISGLVIAAIIFGSRAMMQDNRHSRFYASINNALSETDDTEAFERAVTVIPFEFPRDYGPHPTFQTEWWYYTGNLQDENGHHLGYQLTIFRRALSSNPVQTPSAWRSNHVYFAHFAVTDVDNRQFYSFERFSRGAIGLAGAQASPYRVWLEDWQIQEENGVVKVTAGEDGVLIDLSLSSQKKNIRHGDRGLSRKSAEAGNASYYFSQTRIQTHGRFQIKGKNHRITGYSWLDREWSTSTLQKGDVGWDWFSIQLNNNREVMFFQVRSAAGETSDFSSGTFVAANGTSHHLSKNAFSVRVVRRWKSPQSGITYPAEWDVTLHDFDLRMRIVPYLQNQEHRHSFIYWEGAVKVESNQGAGFGYVELTGYETGNGK